MKKQLILTSFLLICGAFLMRAATTEEHLSPEKNGEMAPDSFIISAGIRLQASFGTKGASNFMVSLSFGAINNFFNGRYNIVPAYQASMNFYGGGIGDNTLHVYRKLNIDFVHAISASAGERISDTDRLSTTRNYFIPITSFNALTAYTVGNPFKSSLTIGTDFIFNNHGRNQQLGFFNININRTVVFGYYNDGPPFGGIGLGDTFDRLWTGGGYLEIYLPKIFKKWDYMGQAKFFYNFDRFTGDVQDAYDISKYMSLRYVPTKDIVQNFYNQSRARIGYTHLRDNFSVSLDYLGHFYYDIQDRSHIILGYSRHLTHRKKQRFLGLEYNYPSLFQRQINP